ncbi:hypothetical protein KKB83_04105 [Patescibacteria group bacterium]|nr:hypothetical protein [Patescibacteria group bacterium]
MSVSDITASYSGHIGPTSLGATWNNLQTSSSFGSAVTGECIAKVERPGSGDYFFMLRGFLDFDTSSLPDNATITSVILNLYSTSVVNQLGGFYVVQSSKTENQIAEEDWDTIVRTAYSNYISGAYSTGAKSVSLNSTAISNISKTGYSKIAIMQSNDYLNSASGQGNDYFAFASYNDITPSKRPYISITWTTPPVVTSGAVSDLTPQYATISGEVTDVGGGTVTSRGICWSKAEDPTISDSKNTSSGQDGTFSVLANSLTPGTKYYYRAFVTTENSTTYGDNLSFVTPSGALIFGMM